MIKEIFNEAIDELNLQLGEGQRIEKNDSVVLIGIDAAIDSLNLINFVLLIEEKIMVRTGNQVTVFKEQHLSEENTPLKNMGTFKKYVEEIMYQKGLVKL